jgi:hypothetical protein
MRMRRAYQRGEEAQTDSGMEMEMEKRRTTVVGYGVPRYALRLLRGIAGESLRPPLPA